MKSLLDERLGVQEPQILCLPPDVHSLDAAEEAIELADAYGVAGGFPLDESQKITLRAGCGERGDGSWAAATVADFEPRQNGKNDSVAARELAGLVLFGERLIIHTAHEFPTANEAFLRLVAVFENWDDLRAKVARIRYANGEQGIEFLSGQRLKYRARTGGSGRGFAMADLVVYDEAQHLQAEHVAASGPARLANPNSQSWYLGSGGLLTSANAWRMRRRALEGATSRFAYVEHTAEDVCLELGKLRSTRPDVLDREAWARANPAYGYRITDEALLTLYEELGPILFARECLCLWEPEIEAGGIFPSGAWTAVQDAKAKPDGGLVFGFDVNPERTWAAIAVSDGSTIELVDHRQGLGWAVDRLVALCEKHQGSVALDPSSPAGVLFSDLQRRNVRVHEVAGRDYVQACGSFFDDVTEQRIKVVPHPDLNAAVGAAAQRPSLDAWSWARRQSDVDISPLVAATLARWVVRQIPAWSPLIATV